MTSPLQQKIKINGPSVVTANRTWDGVVIYRDAHQGAADDVGAIGPYIAPVAVNDNGVIEPGNLREQIRRKGVTIDLPVSA
jgi:hypothetical protein